MDIVLAGHEALQYGNTCVKNEQIANDYARDLLKCIRELLNN